MQGACTLSYARVSLSHKHVDSVRVDHAMSNAIIVIGIYHIQEMKELCSCHIH